MVGALSASGQTQDSDLANVQVELERLEVPKGAVEGSDRAYLHVTGDIMAPALENVGNLVNMPTGEENFQLLIDFPTPHIHTRAL